MPSYPIPCSLLIWLIFNLCDKPNKTKHNKGQRKENANFIDTPRKMPKGSLSLNPQRGNWRKVSGFSEWAREPGKSLTHLRQPTFPSPFSPLSRFPHDKCINYSHAHILCLINTFWIVNFEMRQQNRTKTRSSRQKSSRKKWKGKRSGQREKIYIRNGEQGT